MRLLRPAGLLAADPLLASLVARVGGQAEAAAALAAGLEQWAIPFGQLQLLRLIGEGAFSKVGWVGESSPA